MSTSSDQSSGSPAVPPPQKLTLTVWLILIIASIGFAFDIYELLMLPLIVREAIGSLRPQDVGTPDDWLVGGDLYIHWARTLFFVPALAGGVFGLLGGYMTDRLGRRSVLTWSILLYAFGAFAAGMSTNLYQLLFFRCCVFVGVCVEFVAAVAWLAELFPNPVQRENALGYTQAFSSFGGLLVAVMAKFAAEFAEYLPPIHGGHEAWRYTLISGLIPAIPLILIRPFLPESPAWQKKREAGTLKRPSIAALFSPELRGTTIITTILFATTFGIAFGAIQQNAQILNGHKEVRETVGKVVDEAKERAKQEGRTLEKRELVTIRGNATDSITAGVQFWQEIGGMAGRLLLAVLAVRIVSRRNLFRLFQIPSLVFVVGLYYWLSKNLDTEGSLNLFRYAMFLAGLLVVGQMSFWGNYIPRVFPVHLRGTGESFAANIGGRVIGTLAAFITLTLSASKPPDAAKMALMGAVVAGGYALVGAILTPFLPEPRPEEEHE